MQLDFFPSKTLTFYLAKMFAARILAFLLMLVLVLMMLDLLSTSGKILAVPGNGEEQLWHYVSLRIPQLADRFLPYSVLLATLLTFVTLNQNSEVVAMKAAGLSAHQVLAPMLLTALVVSGLNFAFNERFVTRATASLKAWESNDYGPIPKATRVKSNIYLTDDDGILSAASLTGSGDDMQMQDVTWYRRGPGGIIVEQAKAATAAYSAPGWTLKNAEVFDVQTATDRKMPGYLVAKGVTPEQIELESVDADSLGFLELWTSIDSYEAAGRRTTELRAKWWHKLSGPLAAFLMPLLGAIAAFGLARSGQVFIRALIGMALGFAYFVVDNAALAMGSFGGYPPFLAAWGPFLLFLLIGETVLIRTEE